MTTQVTATRAKALYDSGDLSAAVEEITREVKANPTDMPRRVFLFELLCFAGEWERAARQLDVIGHQGVGTEIGAQVYRNCLRAELDRGRLLRDGLQPHFLAEPPAYVDMHLEALGRVRAGDAAGARRLLDRAEEQRPALSGSLDGRLFADFRDYDDFFAPVLELIVHDKYTWLPYEQVRSVRFEPPSQLRDLVWATASIETAESEMRALVPVLYAGTGAHPDDLVRLGRATDWRELGPELYAGAGLRVFAADGAEVPALEVRTLEFDAADERPAS
ncbi:MAG TPA: type VI secretion system accessory protein TagJ [Pyrinomonadaceae bacterium]